MAPYMYTTASVWKTNTTRDEEKWPGTACTRLQLKCRACQPNKIPAGHWLYHREIQLQHEGLEEGVLPTPIPQAAVCSSNAGCIINQPRPRLHYRQNKLQHDARLEVGILKSTNTTGRRPQLKSCAPQKNQDLGYTRGDLNYSRLK
jgi:hypothetical protein